MDVGEAVRLIEKAIKSVDEAGGLCTSAMDYLEDALSFVEEEAWDEALAALEEACGEIGAAIGELERAVKLGDTIEKGIKSLQSF